MHDHKSLRQDIKRYAGNIYARKSKKRRKLKPLIIDPSTDIAWRVTTAFITIIFQRKVPNKDSIFEGQRNDGYFAQQLFVLKREIQKKN